LRGLPVDRAEALAEQAAARITAALVKPIATDAATFPVGASIGIAIHPRDGGSPDELIKVADERMYGDKRKRSQAA
jgi:GGDEF domain-containing protein